MIQVIQRGVVSNIRIFPHRGQTNILAIYFHSGPIPLLPVGPPSFGLPLYCTGRTGPGSRGLAFLCISRGLAVLPLSHAWAFFREVYNPAYSSFTHLLSIPISPHLFHREARDQRVCPAAVCLTPVRLPFVLGF